MRHRQQGIHLVEMAIVFLIFLIMLFGVIEFSRALYTWNALTEGTRRGARVAAVCPFNDPKVAQTTIFASTGSNSPILPNLTTNNVSVTYTDSTGATSASYATAAFVTVRITGYTLPLFIPAIPITLTAPPFSATFPALSLGDNGDATRTCP